MYVHELFILVSTKASFFYYISAMVELKWVRDLTPKGTLYSAAYNMIKLHERRRIVWLHNYIKWVNTIAFMYVFMVPWDQWQYEI